LGVFQIVTFAVFIGKRLNEIFREKSKIVTRKTAFPLQIVVVTGNKFWGKRDTRTDEFIINPKGRINLIVECQSWFYEKVSGRNDEFVRIRIDIQSKHNLVVVGNHLTIDAVVLCRCENAESEQDKSERLFQQP